MSDNRNVLITAVNSQYIHSNTAVYYLHRILAENGVDADVKSFTTNDDKHDILGEIFLSKPRVVCFSCYIWNIDTIYELSSDIKKIDNSIKIVLGGPEVTYQPKEAFGKSGADLIIRGEGEEVISEVVSSMLKDIYPKCKGCYYESDGVVRDTGIAITGKLGEIPSPFTEFMMNKEQGKLLYYEASRGCPFNCIYCLSSATAGVRYFPIERVFNDLETIIRYSPSIVKFTDRSFNTNEARTLKILDFIRKMKTETCFHLEVFPAGLTENTMKALEEMPRGRIQLEAGIQSVNPRTLEASGRIQDPDKAIANMTRLLKSGNMHIHLDLIAGLPYEDMESFVLSFNATMASEPHMLQIGFLKLLKGTAARDIDGYVYEESPPYEVLSTPWLSFMDLNEIKQVEKCVELFYNTGRFNTFFSHLYKKGDNLYVIFRNLYMYLIENKISIKGISRNNKYEALAGFAGDDIIARECLGFDFMSSYNSKVIPDFLGEVSISREAVFNFLKEDGNHVAFFPEYPDSSPKKLYKICNIGRFDFNGKPRYYLFKYGNRDSVTGLFPILPVKI